MAVAITWSAENGGGGISKLDHGDVQNGGTTNPANIWLRHNGTASITSCALYVNTYSGTYNGGASAATDFTELKAWGDSAVEASFGGVLVNMNKSGSYATGWAVYNGHTVGSPVYGFVGCTATGSSSGTGVTIPTQAGIASAGTIETAETDCGFQIKIQVPTAEDTAGKRQFDVTLSYVYTS